MERSETIVELSKATSKMQGLMRSVPKDSANPFFKMRYASLDAIWDTIRWPLTSNGLSLIQATYEQNEKIYLETLLLHTSGEWVKTILPINATKQDPQAVGSAITYARRYSLSALLGVSADEDDDAEATTEHKSVLTSKKVTQIDQTEHFCQEHKTKFFKTEKMKAFAHPVEDSKEWCYEPGTSPVAKTEGKDPATLAELFSKAFHDLQMPSDVVLQKLGKDRNEDIKVEEIPKHWAFLKSFKLQKKEIKA